MYIYTQIMEKNILSPLIKYYIVYQLELWLSPPMLSSHASPHLRGNSVLVITLLSLYNNNERINKTLSMGLH